MKEKILSVSFDAIPDVRVRVINIDDAQEIIKSKKKYPFELFNSLLVRISTTQRNFEFTIFNGYTWNGADIPRFFWRIIGSRTDNDFLVASMLHDYLLEFKTYIVNEVLNNKVSKKEYRRITSLIFRHVIKEQGTNTIKANVMAWCVDVYQMFNRSGWQCL
ncbi:DUF1353 domain-containing protein [bacterium]|nr:DUF1353 domain-containing protein [bacterium]